MNDIIGILIIVAMAGIYMGVQHKTGFIDSILGAWCLVGGFLGLGMMAVDLFVGLIISVSAFGPLLLRNHFMNKSKRQQ